MISRVNSSFWFLATGATWLALWLWLVVAVASAAHSVEIHEIHYACEFDMWAIDAPSFQQTKLGPLELLWPCVSVDYGSISVAAGLNTETIGFELPLEMEFRPYVFPASEDYRISLTQNRVGVAARTQAFGSAQVDLMPGVYEFSVQNFDPDNPLTVDFGAISLARHSQRWGGPLGSEVEVAGVPEPCGTPMLLAALPLLLMRRSR